MGFSLVGPAGNSGTGILLYGEARDVEVRNGHVRNFARGIYRPGDGNNYRLTNLKIRACTEGIVFFGRGVIITGCEASYCATGFSIHSLATVIDKNVATNNKDYGFYLACTGVIINNTASYNDTGFFLTADPKQLVDRNASVDNTTNWNGLIGCTRGLNTP